MWAISSFVEVVFFVIEDTSCLAYTYRFWVASEAYVFLLPAGLSLLLGIRTGREAGGAILDVIYSNESIVFCNSYFACNKISIVFRHPCFACWQDKRKPVNPQQENDS